MTRYPGDVRTIFSMVAILSPAAIGVALVYKIGMWMGAW
jgi:hypothetical protein